MIRKRGGGLVRLYGPLVYRWTRQAGLQDTDAADVGQEVFRTVAARISDFRRDQPGASFRGAMTSVEQMTGTIDYMAPEQIGDSHGVDIRADIYSLGATLFELLTGRTPYSKYRADTLIRKLNTVAMQPASSVSEFRAEAPEGLAAIVARTLAKDPADRYANPQELAEALQPYAAGADLATLAAKCQDADSRPAADSAYADQAHDTSGAQRRGGGRLASSVTRFEVPFPPPRRGEGV
jgi:serine/threonine protein kinase